MTWFQKLGIGLAILAMGLVGCVASADAQDKRGPFQTGIYLGPQIGYSVYTNELDLNAKGFGSVANVDGVSAKGVNGGGQAGFDFRIPQSSFLVGAFVEGQFGDAEFDLSVAGVGSLVSAGMDNQFKYGLRFGYVTNSGSLIYVGGFLAHADFDWQIGNSGVGVLSKGSEKLDGKGVLAGIETPIWGHATLGIQYSYTEYDDVRFNLGGGLNLDVTPTGHAVGVRANWRLEGLFGQ